METLEGVLDRIAYASEERGFAVVKLHVDGRPGVVTAVGPMIGIQPGETLRLTGRWTVDPSYGEQFRVESVAVVPPATEHGIEKYLGSGLVPGIGKGFAKKLVERFGRETLEVIDRHPERLTEVEGIGKKRSDRIVEAWAEQRGIREVMVFLQGHGVATSLAVKIYKAYGAQAIHKVREDPYRLAIEIYGVGFITADRIAKSLGIPADSPRRAEAGVLHVLGKLSEQGHVFAPKDGLLVPECTELLGLDATLVQKSIAVLGEEGRHVAIEKLPGLGEQPSDEAVYLRPLWVAERAAAARLGQILRSPAPQLSIDVPQAIEWFERSFGPIQLAPEQRTAVEKAIGSKLLVITGGPGTGKTTIVNAIIRILEKKQLRIALAAPTGRAAKRMQEATGRPAATIHRMLEWNPRSNGFDRNSMRPLEIDLLIVDEASMLDIALFSRLLEAVPDRGSLILVGDVDQLPSVGPGNVLQSLIRSNAGVVVTLKQIFRQAEASAIVTNAHRINHGEMPVLAEGDSSDFYFIERAEPEDVLATIKTLLKERIPRRFGLDPVDDIQVLTPMHRGLLGAANLNEELQALLNPEGESMVRGSRVYRVGDKVMQIRNNYDLDVYNGDIGRITAIDREEQKVRVLIDDREVIYPLADLDELVHAYACSIHKSQGSEFPAVVVPVHTQHYVMLQRNLLYTAITRGRKLVVLVGTKRALRLAVDNRRVVERYSRLEERLRAL